MAAPEYVPVKPMDDVRSYESPPRRPEQWRAERPGDLTSGQPVGERFGYQGPDQGYVFVLARRFEGTLTLTEGEHEDDAIAGCTLVALKRASQFGRAPVIHDLTVAFTVWGFLDAKPPAELVAVRKPLFEEAANPHHYLEQRRIVDAVPIETLRLAPTAVTDRHAADWRSLLQLDG
ncbi:MAG TPA: hypothetical protein VGF22_15455 [Acidimicrobiales bacterium]|jgi:hypothetical protein